VAVSHAKSNTNSDWTGTVTVGNSTGGTATIAATDLVRPADWNSAHNQLVTISGAATAGTSAGSGTNLVYGGSNSVTLNLSTAAGGGQTLWIQPAMSQLTVGGLLTMSSGGSTIEVGYSDNEVAYTAMSYQVRPLAASLTLQPNNTSANIWMMPMRVQVPVSASTLLIMQSLSGTITSAATAQVGQTLEAGLYSQHTDPASSYRFDPWWSGTRNQTFWNSGTSSYSFSNNITQGNSAGSNLGTASVMGMRMHTFDIGSVLPPGLYIFASRGSTSTAGYSAAMSRVAHVVDNPLSVAAGWIGSATNASNGYADGGYRSATSNALPASLDIRDIRQSNNIVPFFKIGAL
jgi:hypothetical protein